MARAAEQRNRANEVLEQARALEHDARSSPDRDEMVAHAVMLCAGQVQEMMAPDSVYVRAVQLILESGDVGSSDALHRVRGVLRAASQHGVSAPAPADGDQAS